MGCDSKNFLPKNVTKKDIQEFLQLLGYEKTSSNYFFQYDKFSREQITGIGAEISNTKPYVIHLRTTIWRSVRDHEIHNWTIKQLKKRFGGYFESDEGKNRYLWYSGVERRKSEAGCDLAFYDFKNNIVTMRAFLRILKNSSKEYPIDDISRYYNPLISSTNIGLPFLISVMEEFLNGCYISLLKYSDLKKTILKKSNIQNELLIEVAEKESSVEEVVCRFKSFQNIDSINKNFRELNSKLNFTDSLKRFHSRRKYHEKLSNIIEKRHLLIHRFQIDHDYTVTDLEKDINTIEKIVQIFYDRIIEIYGWNKRDW